MLVWHRSACSSALSSDCCLRGLTSGLMCSVVFPCAFSLLGGSGVAVGTVGSSCFPLPVEEATFPCEKCCFLVVACARRGEMSWLCRVWGQTSD